MPFYVNFPVRFSYENRSELHTNSEAEREREPTEINAQQNILKFERVRIHLLHGSVWFGLLVLVFPFQFFNLLPNNGTHSHFSKSTVIKCHYWTNHWHQQHFTNYHCLCVLLWTYNREKITHLYTHTVFARFSLTFLYCTFYANRMTKMEKKHPNTSRINHWDKNGMHILKTHIAISDYCHRPNSIEHCQWCLFDTLTHRRDNTK